MTAGKKHPYDTDLLDVLEQRVMVRDGAIATWVGVDRGDVDSSGREALQRFSGFLPVSATLGGVKDAFR